ncbi:MAG: carotenoid oxygenase family protein [Candidatus Binatia bacterium]|nr:carotenoid oxygenase family protein [Candidatus Binatia bacterium]
MPGCSTSIHRRQFLKYAGLAAGGLSLPAGLLSACGDGATAAAPPLQVGASVPWWLQNGFAPTFDEIDAFDLKTTGHIPADLDGTYVRNGSNPQNSDSLHWFLGDGMVHGIRFERGRPVWYRNRYIRTSYYEAGVGLGGGISSGLVPGPQNSQSNVSAVYHAGRLLTSGEVGGAYRLDPKDLSTLGPHDFNGAVRTSFTAHPKIDPATGYMHFFGYYFAPPYLTYSVADDNGVVISSQPVEVERTTMIHSFAITDRDAIFWELPVVFEFSRALESPIDAFQWQPEYGSRIGIMPLGGSTDEIRWVEIPNCYVFHEVNAFRDGDDVVIDVCRHDQVFGENSLNDSDLSVRRWKVNTAGANLSFSEEIVTNRAFEIANHDRRFTGRQHRYGWFVTTREHPDTTDLAGIGRIDYRTGRVTAWDPGPTKHANEAFFVPGGPGEGEGWLLSFVYDHRTKSSELVVLDALDVEAGPVGSVQMPRRVPHGFHATWIPA